MPGPALLEPARLGRRGLLAGAGSLLASTGARAAEHVIRLANWGAPNVPQVAAFVDAFTAQVQDGSHGRIAVQHFPAGSVVKQPDVATALQGRVVDICLSVVGPWASSVPAAALLNSVLFHPTDAGVAAAIGPGTKLFGVLAEGLLKRNAVLLGTIDNGAPVVVSRDPMAAPADFRGKSVRVYDRLTSQIVQTLGGAPSTIQVSDVYPALERGTVKAAVGGLQGAVGLREYEVARHMLMTNGVFGTGVTFYVMNRLSLEALPAELQPLVREAGQAAGVKANAAVVGEIANLRAEMVKHGMTVVELEPGTPGYEAFVTALKPLAEQQASRFAPELIEALRQASGGAGG